MREEFHVGVSKVRLGRGKEEADPRLEQKGWGVEELSPLGSLRAQTVQ
jgi:hypothetical protein